MNMRYIQYFVFIALLISTAIGWNWMWGLLFIFWTVPAYLSGSVFFIDMVERAKQPVFYWAILVTWILLGVIMILSDVPIFSAYLT